MDKAPEIMAAKGLSREEAEEIYREETDMNNKGKGSGLALILILVVALIVAFLVVKNLSSLGIGSNTTQETIQDPVQQAQDTVDAINQRIQETQEP